MTELVFLAFADLSVVYIPHIKGKDEDFLAVGGNMNKILSKKKKINTFLMNIHYSYIKKKNL